MINANYSEWECKLDGEVQELLAEYSLITKELLKNLNKLYEVPTCRRFIENAMKTGFVDSGEDLTEEYDIEKSFHKLMMLIEETRVGINKKISTAKSCLENTQY